MAFTEFLCDDGVPANIYLAVATGTHSAGKSTVTNAFTDDDFTKLHGISYEDPYNIAPKYTGSQLGNTNIPVIVAEEAMTAYARIHRLPDLATTGYTFEHQIAVESLAQGLITDAMRIAMRVATHMQPNDATRKGIVFADRSALDGAIYSSLRTPNDQENVDLAEVEVATIGWNTQPDAKSRIWPVRKWSRDFMSRYCDVAFIVDHTEVPVEDNGFRQTDVAFRQQVASDMQMYYESVLGTRIVTLHGDPAARKAIVCDSFMHLAMAQG